MRRQRRSWRPAAVLDARVDSVQYRDPYGNPRGATSGNPWPSGQRGFVGGVEDPTGLTLLGARFYAPVIGAFLSVDPEMSRAES